MIAIHECPNMRAGLTARLEELTDEAHAVVQPSWAKSALSNLKSTALSKQHIAERHLDILRMNDHVLRLPCLSKSLDPTSM